MEMKPKPKLVAVLGPTASGKTALGIQLAKTFDGEVISADSRQVYRGADIGTAKVTEEEKEGVPHHLIDIIEPGEPFSVADFKKRADQIIRYIERIGKLPIVVGGTGFYVEALVDGAVPPEVPPNEQLRGELEKQSAENLYEELERRDPRRAGEVDPHNKRRLVRALEIVDALGAVPERTSKPDYDVLQIGIETSDEELRERITKRAESELSSGLIEETKKLLEDSDTKRAIFDGALGLEYPVVAEYIEEKITKDELKEQLIAKTWQYAKRQKTWLKRDTRIQWFMRDDWNGIKSAVEQFLEG